MALLEASLRYDSRSLRARPRRPHHGLIPRAVGPLCVGLAALTLALFVGAPSAVAADVRVSKSIPFAKTLKVRKAIKNECGLQTVIPRAVAANASNVVLVDGRGDLEIEISDVHGPGGWVFSGPKWVEVKGKLRRGGKVVGDFRAKRMSVADPFAGGTCGILAKCARAIGEDIALWLQEPSFGAEIGDAR